MYYIVIENNFIKISEIISELEQVYLEINNNGRVIREIGINKEGKIIHKFPGDQYKLGKYGLFDLTSFDNKNLKNDLTKEEFENKWNENE